MTQTYDDTTIGISLNIHVRDQTAVRAVDLSDEERSLVSLRFLGDNAVNLLGSRDHLLRVVAAMAKALADLPDPQECRTCGAVESDPRFTLGLVYGVAKVLAEHGYPDVTKGEGADGDDLRELQQALFGFVYAPSEHPHGR